MNFKELENVFIVAEMSANHNGSIANIAGITNQNHTVLGMMPHPERQVDLFQGGTDGKALFDGLLNSLKI